jgi:hypothetical protein
MDLHPFSDKFGIDYSTRRAEYEHQLFSLERSWGVDRKPTNMIKCPRCEAKGITNVFDRRMGVCGICYDVKGDKE